MRSDLAGARPGASQLLVWRQGGFVGSISRPAALDAERLRKDFPIFERLVHVQPALKLEFRRGLR